MTTFQEVEAVVEVDALEELSRFFQLVSQTDTALGMFSEYVDEAWHKLMEDSSAYDQFCVSACGVMIKHVPSSEPGASGFGPILWVKDYEQHFGALGTAWFRDAAGILDTQTYQTYRQTGNFEASWRCVPEQSCAGRPVRKVALN